MAPFLPSLRNGTAIGRGGRRAIGRDFPAVTGTRRGPNARLAAPAAQPRTALASHRADRGAREDREDPWNV
jgi:hypothetical protein